MANSVRGVHVSPGIYTKEEELTYAVKSLGITTLGLVGETQRGPAFQPVSIENWRDFQSVFGGTSTEKFKDTQYPKYELPYIAKSYLSESNQLEVCRVLGLSGYNAGPAWLVTASADANSEYNDSVVLVLRSRGYYDEYYKPMSSAAGEACACGNVYYDYQRFLVGEDTDAICDEDNNTASARKFNLGTVKLGPYKPIDTTVNLCKGSYVESKTSTTEGGNIFEVSARDYGRFNIYIKLSPDFTNIGDTEVDEEKYDYVYAVSLNPNDNDYILKVLGTNNHDGAAPIYVEALYDVAFVQGIEASEITGINQDLVKMYPVVPKDVTFFEPVSDIMTKQEGSLTRSDVGKRFLVDLNARNSLISYHVVNDNGLLKSAEEANAVDEYKKVKIADKGFYKDQDGNTVQTVIVGEIYRVRQFTMPDGKRKYFYVAENEKLRVIKNTEGLTDFITKDDTGLKRSVLVKVNANNLYYRLVDKDDIKKVEKIDTLNDVRPVTVDLNNYKSPYRYASTPWFVSNVKGDYNHIEVNRLFRLHTISDGNNSNMEIKVSIEDINVDEGTFSVVVRDINDTDESIMPVEKFSRCTMVPGDSRFIGFKIGTADGEYEQISNYITVELYTPNLGVIGQNSVPCGFMGYPHGFGNGYQIIPEDTTFTKPVLKYNCNYDEDIKARKQYFGLSSRIGVDIDAFTFKGATAYIEKPEYLTRGFHLDCRMEAESYGYTEGDKPTLKNDIKPTVDGDEGFEFDTVSVNARTAIYSGNPIIDTEVNMADCIYKDTKLRKFTTYFYGGFDGWDEYRQSRTNTDAFKMTKYRGQYDDNTGEGYAFDKINDPEKIGLNQAGITSDWYAYLAAYRQFANPESVDVNLFATPGIDLYNNTLLSQEVIEMLEEERADSLYVATVPDKPRGASDYVDEMYVPEDMVAMLEDTEIDSNYTCTYYPWVKYFDQDNNQYIYLPPTKDVVRNMAQTDNVSYSWFAPAGLERGDVQCTRAHYVTRLADEDVLYAGRINPIKTFAQDGVKVWGQKNLQIEDGQLNRIAVRRLLLRMRKMIAVACLSLIFTPNDAQTKQSLQGLITPIMDNIRSNRGISDYRVEITSSNLTSEDRRELNCRILFKPYAALEYINLTFSVTPEGVSFDDI